MTTLEILSYLQKEIHSTVFATVDDDGLPQTCVIDLMLADRNGLYFLTAKGKSFYERLMNRKYVAVSGMKGQDTMSTVAISLRGKIKNIGQERLDEIFEKNPYMAEIYPDPECRNALEVFCIYEAEGEYFDLGQDPVYRQSFSYGGAGIHETGYQIDKSRCTGCGKCRKVCPVHCISETMPGEIDRSRCLHCGNCFRICRVKAVVKLGKSGGSV